MYTESDVLRIGKRYHNTKRQYLLINPLQAKHIPVSPTKAYEMMCALGEKLYQAYPETDCIIGFAETATAIAECIALHFPKEVFYIQTTRENLNGEKINFLEEHSHAVDQSLVIGRLEGKYFEHILLIDDEISTGKTVLNIINELKKELFPDSTFSVGSIINRMPNDVRWQFYEMGIEFTELVHIENQDFESIVNPIRIQSPREILERPMKFWLSHRMLPHKDPRRGVERGKFANENKNPMMYVDDVFWWVSGFAKPEERILILGTEECMFPALLLGKMIEEDYPDTEVFCHATTRSPIGISSKNGYPITSGYKIRSFYEENRDSYIYQVANYHTVIVMTDSTNQTQIQKAMQDIVILFSNEEEDTEFILIAMEGKS